MKFHFKKLLFFAILFFGCVFCIGPITGVLAADKGVDSEKNPKLSIVMPVYNVEPYLDEALDSAENQTYKDFEIICVNDGSTDNSKKILERHARRDKRIRIINQENQGVGEARNVGIRESLGDYIYFLDPDDILAPHTMEKSIRLLEKYNADASEFEHHCFYYTKSINMSKYRYNKKLPVKVIEAKKDENPIQKYKVWPIPVWSRVYRKSFLVDNNLYFKKGLKTSEDTLFNLYMKASMKRLVKDKNIGYFYRAKRPGSIMNTDYKTMSKRLKGYLTIVHELALNKDRFKFKNSERYLLTLMLSLTYGKLKDFKPPCYKSIYADRAYREIKFNFAEKYGIKLNKSEKQKLEKLKSWAKKMNVFYGSKKAKK